MILADTSVWVDHLRHGDDALAALLERRQVVVHPWVIGELALGSIRNRQVILGSLGELPAAVVADHAEVMALVERHQLWSLGVGYVDVHLLASVLLTPDTHLWSRDRALADAARRFERGADLA